MKQEKFTVEKFLDLLPIVADKQWRVNEDESIRDKDGRCPICSLANEIDPDITYSALADMSVQQLGMEYNARSIDSIINAADDTWKNKTIRAKMLAILIPNLQGIPD